MNIVLLEDLAVPASVMEDWKAKLNEQGHTLHIYNKTSDAALLQEECKEADAIILANMPLPWSAIEQADKLKFIDVAFTGTDHVPVKEASETGIVISNASVYATERVAELCIAFAIELLRKLPALETAGKEGKTKAGLRGRLVHGKTVGIVGTGHIGTRTAEYFKALGAHVIGCNHSGKDNPVFDEMVSLEDLLKRSDLVSLHTPLTDSTRHLIGAEQLSLMKHSAFLINTARGAVVDTDALSEALKKGTIAGAALDVYDKEPPLPKDCPFFETPNTLMTPHMGFDSEESMQIRAEIVFDNLQNWLAGHPLNVVNAAAK